MDDERPSFGIVVVGAAGSGTTTVGRAVAAELGWRHVDLDAVVWAATEPPFTIAYPSEVRADRLRDRLHGAPRWVLSGSPGAWSAFLVPRLLLAVFLQAPPAVRIARLRAREAERRALHSPEAQPLDERLEAFLAWAALYDEGPTQGRSLSTHEAWLSAVPAPILRLDSKAAIQALTRVVLAHPALCTPPPVARKPSERDRIP